MRMSQTSHCLNIRYVYACALFIASYLHCAALEPQRYLIDAPNDSEFHEVSALTLLDDILKKRPDLKQRMLDGAVEVRDDDGELWAYRDQSYGSELTMRHLIASQIKRMVELGEVDDVEDLFDEDYGIGSKAHKDKGTINYVFSLWGHPVRKYVLQGGRGLTRDVYDSFRLTIKNSLKAYLRKQPLAWHMQPAETKQGDILKFLEQNHKEAFDQFRKELKALGLELEEIIRRALVSDLLS